ncbi:MAG: PfkB family kinase, nonfunctional [Parcubacteria group bacterium GW2011_GWA2_43_9b]|nr:MAG: PfkB family kinase, nonfunctional [Parcubacteria group bacterium GW2011_GWA2_43_9b]
MFDVVTFGSATRDIFVRSRELKIIDSREFATGKALAMEAGGKIYIEELFFATGGGGTNCAVTFALQGLKTVYVGLIGNDPGGLEIFRELNDLGGDCNFIKTTAKAKTADSIILSVPDKERSILVYEGASHLLSLADIPFEQLKQSKWFYLSGLAGESAETFEPIINFAADNKIKLAVNPGRDQLTRDLNILKKLLNKIDILLVNQEEASLITGVDYKNESELFRKFDELVSGIAVMSKGKEGVAVSDGQNIYRAGIPESGYVDRTGSGDAFGAGLVSVIIRNDQIPEAIQLGTANATATIQKLGAKKGLLKKGDFGPWEKVQVKIEKL